jgi:hypothetical protein
MVFEAPIGLEIDMTRVQGLPRLTRMACSAAAALLLFGCGGGDGGDALPAATQGTISGSVVKGPVSGATVSAFGLSGGAKGAQLATAATDAQGAFTMSIGAYSGPVMLQMSGGTYTDEATGATMTMAAGDLMTAVLPSMAAGSSVNGIQVTPVTTMAQAMAMNLAGGMTEANAAAANAALGNYFMAGDILHTQPMNPLVAGSGVAASQASMNYGMTLAAMSQYAKSAGLPTSSSVVTAMMNDASDGIMDGRMAGNQIAMGGGMMSGGMMSGGTPTNGMMSADAGRAGLAAAMAGFMNSSANKSGLTMADMAALMQQMQGSDGRMH